MIILEQLDLDQRQATVRVLGADAMGRQVPGARLLQLLGELGCDSLRCILPSDLERTMALDGSRSNGVDPRHDTPRIAPVASLVAAGLTHRCRMHDGVPLYVGRVVHHRDSLEVISIYCDVLLSTLAARQSLLSALRLALYEICANVLEHGRPLVADAGLEVALRCERSAVSGWIEDRCERFDPLAGPAVALPDRALQGHRRGYGISIIRSTLDSLSHRHDGAGNRLEFRKELPA